MIAPSGGNYMENGYYIAKPGPRLGEPCPSISEGDWMIVHIWKFERFDDPGVFETQVEIVGDDYLFCVEDFVDYVGPLELEVLASLIGATNA